MEIIGKAGTCRRPQGLDELPNACRTGHRRVKSILGEDEFGHRVLFKQVLPIDTTAP